MKTTITIRNAQTTAKEISYIVSSGVETRKNYNDVIHTGDKTYAPSETTPVLEALGIKLTSDFVDCNINHKYRTRAIQLAEGKGQFVIETLVEISEIIKNSETNYVTIEIESIEGLMPVVSNKAISDFKWVEEAHKEIISAKVMAPEHPGFRGADFC